MVPDGVRFHVKICTRWGAPHAFSPAPLAYQGGPSTRGERLVWLSLFTQRQATGGGGGTWASRTGRHSKAGCGRPEAGGVWTAKTVKRPSQQPAQPQYATYRAPLTRKRHTPPHPAQPQHTNHWAPRTRKRHQQEHRPQRPTERNDPTQHVKGRTGDCPGPRKETTTRRNVTQGGGGMEFLSMNGQLAIQGFPAISQAGWVSDACQSLAMPASDSVNQPVSQPVSLSLTQSRCQDS